MADKKYIYYEYFNESILPKVKDIEKYRKKAVLKVILYTLLFFFLGITFAGIFIVLIDKLKYNVFVWTIILFSMYAFLIKSIVYVIEVSKEFSLKLQEDLLPLFFKPCANFINWPQNHSIETVIESGLFPNFDTQEDIKSFFGIYKNTNVIVCDTKLTLPINSCTKQNLFRGVTIQLELEKSFDNHILIIKKLIQK